METFKHYLSDITGEITNIASVIPSAPSLFGRIMSGQNEKQDDIDRLNFNAQQKKLQNQFNQFYLKNWKYGVGFLKNQKIEPADAEDILQKVWVKCWRRFEEYLSDKKNDYWFFNILRDELRYYFKVNKRPSTAIARDEIHLASHYQSAEGDVIQAEQIEIWQKSLAKLNDLEQTVLELRLRKFSYPQIAVLLELNHEAVRSTTRRIVKKLAESWAEFKVSEALIHE